jgi:hypothetical protein
MLRRAGGEGNHDAHDSDNHRESRQRNNNQA